MTIELALIIILGIVNVLLFKTFIKIFLKFKIYDIPDFSRKIHTSKIPLVGGIVFLINILLYLPFIFFLENLHFFGGVREMIAFFVGAVLVFLIGLYDDRFILKANSKLFFISLIVIITISISDTYKINELSFLFYKKNILLENFGSIFSIFCILVFINAFNMMDGINGLSVSYFLICLIYIFLLNLNTSFFLFLIIPALIFLYFNFRNKSFLGDSGSLLLGFILSCLFIKTYNEKLIYADQIVLLMIIPGIDMLRVAFKRVLEKKHPFNPDQSHLHHFLLKKYNFKVSYFSIIIVVSSTALLSMIIENEFINLIQIFILILLYSLFINFSKSK